MGLTAPHTWLFPKAYEKQRGARREEQKELQRAAAQDQVRGFLEKEAAIVSRPLNPFTPRHPDPEEAQPGPSKDKDKEKDKALPSFWIPSLTPEAKATKLEKPVRPPRVPLLAAYPVSPPSSLTPPPPCPPSPRLLPPTVKNCDLPHVGETSANVRPDQRALHRPGRLPGPSWAHHALRALRVRCDPRQPQQRHPLCCASALVSPWERVQGRDPPAQS